jgi:hypothetical protein
MKTNVSLGAVSVRSRLVSAVLAVVVFVLPAAAHHGWGSYVAEKPITMEGVIENLAMRNPHSEMTLKHDGASWLVTLAPLSRMNARGVTAAIKNGEKVVAYGYPKRDGTKEIRAEWVQLGGKRFELR